MYNLSRGLLLMLLLTTLVGCGSKEYYQAVKEQNITMQLRLENERLIREDKQRQHDKDMIALIEKLSVATGTTTNTYDDFMAAMLLTVIQDKSTMADVVHTLTHKEAQLHPIKAPDSVGDTIQKATPAVLGIGGITASILQSSSMADIAIAGIKNAGVNATDGSAINTGQEGMASGNTSQDETQETTTTTTTTDY